MAENKKPSGVKTITLNPTNLNSIIPCSTDGLKYISYTFKLFSVELLDTAYTIKTAIYPDGKIVVTEKIGKGKISGRRLHYVEQGVVSELFNEITDCINNTEASIEIYADDCSGALTLYYKDKSIRVDRSVCDRRSERHIDLIVEDFFNKNSISAGISEEGRQKVIEMEQQARRNG